MGGVKVGNANHGYLPNFDGNWNNDTNTGTFNLNVNNSGSAYGNIGGRLTLCVKE